MCGANDWLRKHLVVGLLVSELLHPTELSSSMESLAAYDASVGSPGPVHQSQRTKRMRTSFKHHQLRTMKNYFAINQNPDAKDLKQLAQKTGLSKRVLQVRRGRSLLRYVRIIFNPIEGCPRYEWIRDDIEIRRRIETVSSSVTFSFSIFSLSFRVQFMPLDNESRNVGKIFLSIVIVTVKFHFYNIWYRSYEGQKEKRKNKERSKFFNTN